MNKYYYFKSIYKSIKAMHIAPYICSDSLLCRIKVPARFTDRSKSWLLFADFCS